MVLRIEVVVSTFYCMHMEVGMGHIPHRLLYLSTGSFLGVLYWSGEGIWDLEEVGFCWKYVIGVNFEIS